MEYYLITFSSTHAAIEAQKELKGKFSFQVMPTLRVISSSCGISLKVKASTLKEIKDCMNCSTLGEGMYKIYFVTLDEVTEM